MSGRELTLAPYEFIAGRLSSPKECFLTENVFRNQRLKLEKAGLLKKTTNSLTNHYSAYIWVTDRFNKTNNQPNNQPSTNHQPTVNHKERREKISLQKDHPPLPPSKVVAFESVAEGLIDDSFQEIPLIEVYQGVFLNQTELDECVAIKGSLDSVKHAIEFIMRSPGRKKKIQNWPNAMATWTIKSTIKPRATENEAQGKRLEKQHAENPGWRCQVYRDTVKDQKGLLFYNNCSNGSGGTIFVSFIDPEFKEKVVNALREKKMMKALIPKS